MTGNCIHGSMIDLAEYQSVVAERDALRALVAAERDEAPAECNARARDVMHLEAKNDRLRALVAQQREALRELVATHAPVCFGCCAACKEARAVLAQEVPGVR